MILELNPLKWFPAKAVMPLPNVIVPQVEQVSTTAKAEEKTMGFLGVLKAIGRAFEKGFVWVAQFAVPIEKLVALIFPAELHMVTEIADATGLIQNAVLLVEQKYAASGVQDGTGKQKSAEVLLLAGQAVTSLLTKAGVKDVTTDYVQQIVDAVVAILNVQTAPPALAAALQVVARPITEIGS